MNKNGWFTNVLLGVLLIAVGLLSANALGYTWQAPLTRADAPAVAAVQASYNTPVAAGDTCPACDAAAAQASVETNSDDKVVIAFGGKQRITGDATSGYEGIWALHIDWLKQAGGYGLQGDLIALFCGQNGIGIPADAQCRITAQAFVDTWKPAEGLKSEFNNDGSFQFAKVDERLYIFDWNASVKPNQVSSVKWTGSSFVACQNDTGPAGQYNGDGVGPCTENYSWIPWTDANSLPEFAPYLEEYNQLVVPTAAALIQHGNPMLLAVFTK